MIHPVDPPDGFPFYGRSIEAREDFFCHACRMELKKGVGLEKLFVRAVKISSCFPDDFQFFVKMLGKLNRADQHPHAITQSAKRFKKQRSLHSNSKIRKICNKFQLDSN